MTSNEKKQLVKLFTNWRVKAGKPSLELKRLYSKAKLGGYLKSV